MKRKMTPERQVKLWVAGDARCPNSEGACCPDFSCCEPGMMWASQERVAYQAAMLSGDHETMRRMSTGAIIEAIVGAGGEVLSVLELPGTQGFVCVSVDDAQPPDEGSGG